MVLDKRDPHTTWPLTRLLCRMPSVVVESNICASDVQTYPIGEWDNCQWRQKAADMPPSNTVTSATLRFVDKQMADRRCVVRRITIRKAMGPVLYNVSQ